MVYGREALADGGLWVKLGVGDEGTGKGEKEIMGRGVGIGLG